MKLKSAAITILVSDKGTTITLHDKTSSMSFAEVTLTPEQLSMALSRLSYTPCEIELRGLEHLDKQLTAKEHVFEITKEEKESHRIDKVTGNYDSSLLYKRALETCPDGWRPDNSFNRQNTFFNSDGKMYCRVTIRNWA